MGGRGRSLKEVKAQQGLWGVRWRWRMCICSHIVSLSYARYSLWGGRCGRLCWLRWRWRCCWFALRAGDLSMGSSSDSDNEGPHPAVGGKVRRRLAHS